MGISTEIHTSLCTSKPAFRSSQNFSASAASGNLPAIPTMASFGFREVLGVWFSRRVEGACKDSFCNAIPAEVPDFNAPTKLLAALLGPHEIISHLVASEATTVFTQLLRTSLSRRGLFKISWMIAVRSSLTLVPLSNHTPVLVDMINSLERYWSRTCETRWSGYRKICCVSSPLCKCDA